MSRVDVTLDGFVNALLKIGDLLILLTQTIIIAFGVPVMLAFFIVVEQHRVMAGIGLFEVDAQAASVAAWALVLVNLTVGFVIVWREDRAKNRPKDRKTEFAYKPSLRLKATGWLYWLGFPTGEKKWKPIADSIAHLEVKLAKIIKTSILILALGGSMRNQIALVSGAGTGWQDGLTKLFTESTLLDVVTWAGGLVFAFAIVRAVEVLSRYIAGRVIEIRAQMKRKEQQRPQRSAPAESGRPVWGEYRSEGIAPVKVMRNGKRMYQCPSCGKEMSRQGWSKHGCRFTSELTGVDVVDAEVDASELVDIGQPVNLAVNPSIRASTRATHVNGGVN